MKKRLFLLTAVILILGFGAPAHGAPSPPLSIKILNHHDQEQIPSRAIKLILLITPAPNPAHPVHLHLYINGQMATMFTVNARHKSLILHHLPPGKDVITIVQANPITHQNISSSSGMGSMGEMGGMKMKGNNMDGMGQMDNRMGTPEKIGKVVWNAKLIVNVH